MIDAFTSPLQMPVFVDHEQPPTRNNKKPDDLKEWLANRMKERIQKIKDEANNE